MVTSVFEIAGASSINALVGSLKKLGIITYNHQQHSIKFDGLLSQEYFAKVIEEAERGYVIDGPAT